MNIDPRKDIIHYFDEAENLLNEKEKVFEKIDQMIDLLKEVEVEEISGGYFYNCKNTPGLCGYEDEAKVYVAPHQFTSIKNEEYKALIKIPITSKLYNLGGAMTNIDLSYPLLFKISNAKEIENYETFQKRISQVSLYVKPTINEQKSPHINGIEYLEGLKNIIENNLPEVLDAYKHHVETLRETY